MPSRARARLARGDRPAIRRRRERPFLLCPHEQFLPEERHFAIPLPFVECDDVVQRLHARGRSQPGEIRVQAGLELVQQDLDLAVVENAGGRDVGGIDDDRAASLHVRDGRLDDAIGWRAVAEVALARDADPCALERVLLERRGVVRAHAARRLRRGVMRIDAGHRAQQERRVRDRARHRTRRILRARNRNDARAADEADGRLDADERRSPTTGRRSSRRSPCRRRQPRGSPRSPCRFPSSTRTGFDRARTGSSPGRRARSIRSWTSSIESSPTRSGWSCRESPLRRAQAIDHERVARRYGAFERERAGGRRHAIAGVDVVFDENRNAVQRPARAFRLALRVERVRDRRASGFVSITERSDGPARSIRAMRSR